jgi:hypothetical protein
MKTCEVAIAANHSLTNQHEKLLEIKADGLRSVFVRALVG